MSTTDTTPPRVQFKISLEEHRDLARALRWLVRHYGALQERAVLIEPENPALAAKEVALLQAWSSAYAREVLEQLGAHDLMRRMFVDDADPLVAVKPEAVRSLARAVLEELAAEEQADDARKEGAMQ